MNEFWFIIAKVLVLIGSINWLSIGAFNVNLVKSSFLYKMEHTIYILVGIAAIFLASHRDYFLPFLGRTHFPQSIVENQIPKDADTSVTITVQPGAKVVYWAAEQTKQGMWNSPNQAYGFYKNVGVTTSNALGQAILRVRAPSGYSTPWIRKEIYPHIHYRVEDPNKGMWGPVKTVPVP